MVVVVKFPVGTEATPKLSNTTVWFAPELIVYVTVALGVPVKAIALEVPKQIVAFPEIVAVGNGFTVTVAVIGKPVQPLPEGVIV